MIEGGVVPPSKTATPRKSRVTNNATAASFSLASLLPPLSPPPSPDLAVSSHHLLGLITMRWGSGGLRGLFIVSIARLRK